MAAWLGVCEGDVGIPLWTLNPTPENVPRNTLVKHLEPYQPCIVLVDYHDGTSLVAYDGIIAYAVTECLVEVLT